MAEAQARARQDPAIATLVTTALLIDVDPASLIAARTERIHLAPNVVNLQLRPPAVLARAAISLDLLSGGRIELGTGAGGFPDAVEAMGGSKRTGAEAVGCAG